MVKCFKYNTGLISESSSVALQKHKAQNKLKKINQNILQKYVIYCSFSKQVYGQLCHHI